MHQVTQTMKFGGGCLMVQGYLIWWNVGPLVRINGITKKEQSFHILNTNLSDFVDESSYPEQEVTFQKDGDPKITAKKSLEAFTKSAKTFKLLLQLAFTCYESELSYAPQTKAAAYQQPSSSKKRIRTKTFGQVFLVDSNLKYIIIYYILYIIIYIN